MNRHLVFFVVSEMGGHDLLVLDAVSCLSRPLFSGGTQAAVVSDDRVSPVPDGSGASFSRRSRAKHTIPLLNGLNIRLSKYIKSHRL
jgi:hypothetical protein